MRRANQAVLEDGDEEVGGVIKTLRTKRRRNERPGKNKTPRPKQAQVSKNQREEGIEMNKNSSAQAVPVAISRFEICPVCGFYNKSVKAAENGEQMRYLVCKGDNDRYLAYARQLAGELKKGGKPEQILSKVEWVLSQLDISRFEQELEAARLTRANANVRIDEKVRIAAGGKTLPREIFNELRAGIATDINNQDYFLVRRLNARLQAARKLKPELEQMLAAKVAEPAPAEPIPIAS